MDKFMMPEVEVIELEKNDLIITSAGTDDGSDD